jgi:hypothetical protein
MRPFGSTAIIQIREVSKRFKARKKKVRAPSHGGEGRLSGDFLADRTLRNLVFERAVRRADDRVAFITEIVEVLVVSRHRPDRGTIGGSRADRDYRMSTYDKAPCPKERMKAE